MTRHSTEQSVLGPGTRVIGRITGDGAVRIEGSLRGDVEIGGDAEIAPGGSVEGSVQADRLDVQGSLIGDVNARGAVAIHDGAMVRGELKGREISIEPGARVSVRLDSDIELDLSALKRR
jgi:cytoskeletal protein CcmA (bactofilin family)